MNKLLSRLTSAERRFVVGVAVLFFVVINVFLVWPHYSDWGRAKQRINDARGKFDTYQRSTNQIPELEAQLKTLESEGRDVSREDQAIQFIGTVQNQAAQDGVQFLGNTGRQLRVTNQFFVELTQSINVEAGEKEMVNFLYNLGSGNSLIRVRDLSLRPNPAGQKLNASITLVASYQKTPTIRPATPPAMTPPAVKPAVATSPVAKPVVAKPPVATPPLGKPLVPKPLVPKPPLPKPPVTSPETPKNK
jgi:Tfp pilus assembly protein PilO